VRKKGKESFKVPESILVACGTISTGKMRLSAGEYCLQQWKIKGNFILKNW
jgi:hypothetical protein